MALVVVALIAEYGTEYLFAAVFLAGIFQLIMGLCKVGRLIKYIPQCVMTGFVDSLAIIIFMSQIKNALGGGLTMYALVAAGIVIVYLFPRITKAVPSTLIAIIVVTAASVFLGLTTTSIGDMGNMTAALPDVHLPTLLLSLETWKIVLPYSISLAFVGLIETLLTQQVVDQMTETTSDTNRESCSQGITNMVCGCIGGMPGCAMIGQAIVNVNSGGRGRLSNLVSGSFLMILIFLLNDLMVQIPLAALTAVMITVSISTFDWGALRRLHRMPKSDALVILIVVAVVVATNNLAYGVILGLALTAIFFSLHMSSLKVEEIRDGKTLIYIVKGQLFFASTEAFTEALNFHNDAKTIILDLSQARLWDESAAAAIRGALMHFENNSNHVQLCGIDKSSCGLVRHLYGEDVF